MADRTRIEWTDATWNPNRGCTRVSEACRNCYAEVMAARFSDPGQWGHGLAQRVTLPGGGVDHRWTGKVAMIEDQLDQPLRWKRRRRIFVNSTSDLFHDAVPDDWIDRVFAVMALCPQHTFQVLTKRPERMLEYVLGLNCDGARRFVVASAAEQIAQNFPIWDGKGYRLWDGYAGKAWDQKVTAVLTGPQWPLRNVWLGTSVEDQASADQRIPYLLATPAAVRFLSVEPMLGPVDFYATSAAIATQDHPWRNGPILQGLDWVICGGESGPGARPMHPDWARSLRDQCVAAGVPFFFKQNGQWLHETASDAEKWDWEDADQRKLLHVWDDGTTSIRLRKADAGRLLDGRTWDEMPGVAHV